MDMLSRVWSLAFLSVALLVIGLVVLDQTEFVSLSPQVQSCTGADCSVRVFLKEATPGQTNPPQQAPAFTCPTGTTMCTKKRKSICCPATGYDCVEINKPFTDGEPFCSPKAQAQCAAGTTLCTAWSSNICCPAGTTCTSILGAVAVCKEQGSGGSCPAGQTKCGDYFCCGSGESCIPNPSYPNDASLKMCSAITTSCTAPKTLCSATQGSGYPNVCCNPNTCMVNPSGRAFCNDGDPGI